MNFNDLTTVVVLAQNDVTPEQKEQAPNPLTSMLPMVVLMFVIFYFIIIRPQRKRQKEMQQMIDNMRVGDAVISAGGIHGVITNKTDTTVTVRVAPNVKLRFDKASITKVTPKDKARDDAEETEEDSEEDDSESPKKKAAAKKKAPRKKTAATKKPADSPDGDAEDDSDAETSEDEDKA